MAGDDYSAGMDSVEWHGTAERLGDSCGRERDDICNGNIYPAGSADSVSARNLLLSALVWRAEEARGSSTVDLISSDRLGEMPGLFYIQSYWAVWGAVCAGLIWWRSTLRSSLGLWKSVTGKD